VAELDEVVSARQKRVQQAFLRVIGHGHGTLETLYGYCGERCGKTKMEVNSPVET